MTSNRQTQREIFAEAAALAAADRPAYLEEACGGQAETRAEIERLLRELEESEFMEIPAAPRGEATVEAGTVEADKPGDRIGNYRLLEQIGEGGFGVVWVAEQDRPLRRRVALKIIKLGMDTKDVLARFEQERQALALMEHPNIARVLDAGATTFGRPFFVMELVAGIKVTDFCDQAKLSTEQRVQLFAQVCHAVQHAHQKGIIHRDLKPSNILVTLHDGEPASKVIDFGVAKAIHEGQRLTDLSVYTKRQQIIGTPLYMSPEQAEMSGLDIDTRSDIYSLGVVLYELLTGRTPFDPEDLRKKGFDEVRRTIREQEPPKPSAFVSAMGFQQRMAVADLRRSDGAKLIGQIRGDLDWIVMMALEKNRTRRYLTANGLAEDLHRYMRSEPVLAGPPSGVYRFRRFVRRNRLACLAAGAIGAAILVILAILVASTARIRQERDLKGVALGQSQASEQKAREELFLALLNAARAGRYSRQMGERLDSLEALAQAALIHPDDRLRDEAIAAMALPDVRLGAEWQLEPGEVIDPTGRISALPSSEGIITLRSVPDRREVGRIEGSMPGLGTTQGLYFNRDGSFLAQIDDRSKLRIWRVRDARSVIGDEAEQCSAVAFSPNGREAAVGQGDSVRCYDLASGVERIRWITQESVAALDFNPDNRRLAVGYQKSEVVSIYDAESGADLGELPLGAITGQVVAWHPDGVRLAISGADPRILIWDTERKMKLATIEGHAQEVTTLSFHPDGELLAAGGWEGVYRLWQPSSGRLEMQLPRAISSFSFMGGGRWLGAVNHGKTGRLLEVTPCPEYRTLVSNLGANEGTYYDGDIGPDGLVATAMEDGVRFWDLSSGREVAFEAIEHSYCVLFHDAGREVLVCGREGLFRLPIQRSGGTTNGVRLGARRKIALPFAPTRMSASQDGRTLAVVGRAETAIVDLATESVQAPVLPHEKSSYVAMAPDGRWVASSGYHSNRVRLWNAKTGEMVKEWEAPERETRVFFTPDSRTLAISGGDEFRFQDVESLREIRRVPREIALHPSPIGFSPDGKLMALEMAPGVIHFQEVATGRTVARLQDPNGDIATTICFTPDGTRLVTVDPYVKVLHVWDLRVIRQRLRAMGLDWDWPDFPAAGRPAKSS